MNRFVLAFVAVLVLGQPLLPEFTVTLLNYIGLYALVALGLVLLTGIGGLTSFGQAAFVGVGAYATAYLTTVHGVSPWWTLLVGMAVTTAIYSVARFGRGDGLTDDVRTVTGRPPQDFTTWAAAHTEAWR